MKKYVLFILILTATKAWSQPANVAFEIQGLNADTVYVGYHFGSQKYLMDTLAVKDDAFVLEVEKVKKGLYFVYRPDYYLEFILHLGDYRLSTSRAGGTREMEVQNSKENSLFQQFQKTMIGLQSEQRSLSEKLQEASGEDSLQIRRSLQQLATDQEEFRQGLISDNPETFLASFVGLMDEVAVPKMDEISDEKERQKRRYNYYKEHYFDNVDLSDPALLRTPLLHNKVMKYFNDVLVQHPDTLIQGVDFLFNQVNNEPELFRYWLVTLFKKYAEAKIMGLDKVMIHLIEHYYLTPQVDWISEEYEKTLREEVAYIKHNVIGNEAPPLNVVDTLMQPFSLRQVASEYTLLFIYDPDCGHCKKAIKKLEELDTEFANQGVEVVAVCTTTDVDKWKNFVSEHNPMWHHTIDPTGKSYFRVYYDVRSTPKIYLLDGQKKIIAKKLDVEQLLDFVKNAEKL
ncbi:TlpA family protein disulfide reductase [Marinoscillum furvescens]|nr:TlpA family protein disulfide reductase [Marinoscillum furvescens]